MTDPSSRNQPVKALSALQVGAGIAALASQTDGRAPLVFSAVKTAFGHTEPAAGAAGLCGAMLRCAGYVSTSYVSIIAAQQGLGSHSQCSRNLCGVIQTHVCQSAMACVRFT